MLGHPVTLPSRGSRGFSALARLAPGATLTIAQADLTNVARQLEQAYPDTNEKRGVEVSPLVNEVFGQIRPAISLLFGAVTFVLVIACASVASLLLARTETRRREFSLRRAIGADEVRLLRLMLSESAWVVLLGGSVGILLSLWAGEALLALSPVQLPSFATPGVDWRTMLFVLALGVLITVVVGLSPLRSMRKHSLAQDLREGAIEGRGGSSARTLQVIVAGQVAVTVMLPVGAVLFGRSFAALARFDPGFDSDAHWHAAAALGWRGPRRRGHHAARERRGRAGDGAPGAADFRVSAQAARRRYCSRGGAIFYAAGMGAVTPPTGRARTPSRFLVTPDDRPEAVRRTFGPTDLGVANNNDGDHGDGAASGRARAPGRRISSAI